MTLIEGQVPPVALMGLLAQGSKGIKLFHTLDGLAVLVSIDRTPHGDLMHVSVSRPDRYPAWDEILAVRYELFPRNKDVMMVMPRDGDYVKLHPNCFHMWETPEKWGIQ